MDCSCEQHPEPPPPPPEYVKAHRFFGPVLHAIGLSCRRFTELSLAKMDARLSPVSQIKWLIHWLLCGICRPIPKRLKRLKEIIREADRRGGLADPSAKLSEESYQRFRDRLREEAAK